MSMFDVSPSFVNRNKATSSRLQVGGVYIGIVTRTSTTSVHVQVPKVSGDVEYGPCIYSGVQPAVGDRMLVGFLDNQLSQLICYGTLTKNIAPLESPTFTGIPTAPTAPAGTNTTQVATTAYVQNLITGNISLNNLALTGIPTAPTAAIGTNTTQIANTAFVQAAVNKLLQSAPAALDTLDELAAALGDDSNFATTITNSLATKAPLASPSFTGSVTVPASTAASFGSSNGSTFWRPIDVYNNSYFKIGSGSWYSDAGYYFFRNSSSVNLMTIDSSGNVAMGGSASAAGVTLTGTLQALDSGTDNSGALYVGVGTGTTATGGIEASWANASRPQISIGVTRDGSKVRSLYTYHGWGGLYTGNTRRVYWDGTGVEVTGTFWNNSTIRVKENIRPSGVGEFSAVATTNPSDAFDKFLRLQSVVFDYIDKPQDPIWDGCDVHEYRHECEAAECPNSTSTHLEEHVCDKGMCYGTLDNPCPRYTQTRNRTHYIAEDLADIYPHIVAYNDAREVTGVDALAWRVEHANVTQHLIREVRALRAELETLKATQQ